MFTSSSLLATLTFALAVAASPVVTVRDNLVTLSIAKRVNFTGSASLLERDQTRVRNLKRTAERKKAENPSSLAEDVDGSVAATNQAATYTVNVGAG
jgi:cathepsin E